MKAHISIHSIKEIQEHLQDPKETLIIFDVDYVLTHPNEAAYQFPNFTQNIHFIKEVFTSLTPLQRDLFANLMVFDDQGSSLVEKQTPELIAQFQKQGYKTIALTASLSSQVEDADIKKIRLETLKGMGIDFSPSFPELEEVSFNSLISNRETYPLFYHGILFSNGENQANQKGAVLQEFLKAIDFAPKHILVVDDRKPNLETIQASMNELEIEVTGCHYKGSLIYPSVIVEKDVFEKKWLQLAEKAKELSQSNNETLSSNDS